MSKPCRSMQKMAEKRIAAIKHIARRYKMTLLRAASVMCDCERKYNRELNEWFFDDAGGRR